MASAMAGASDHAFRLHGPRPRNNDKKCVNCKGKIAWGLIFRKETRSVFCLHYIVDSFDIPPPTIAIPVAYCDGDFVEPCPGPNCLATSKSCLAAASFSLASFSLACTTFSSASRFSTVLPKTFRVNRADGVVKIANYVPPLVLTSSPFALRVFNRVLSTIFAILEAWYLLCGLVNLQFSKRPFEPYKLGEGYKVAIDSLIGPPGARGSISSGCALYNSWRFLAASESAQVKNHQTDWAVSNGMLPRPSPGSGAVRARPPVSGRRGASECKGSGKNVELLGTRVVPSGFVPGSEPVPGNCEN